MTSNDQIIFESLLRQRKSVIAPDDRDSKFFEIFAAEQILKNYDLSYEELETGLVDHKGNDGGVDALYTFVNGELVVDDTDEVDYPKQDITIDVFIIQAKLTGGFSDKVINTLMSSTGELFDLQKEVSQLRGAYDEKLLNVVNNFRRIYLSLAIRFPKLNIYFFYATKGEQVHQNVERRAKSLEATVKNLFSSCNFSFRFLGCRAFLDLAGRSPSEPLELVVAETPVSPQNGGFICLVGLRDYFGFITEANGELRRGIFEANVRDYQGKVDVNKAIKDTLENPSDDDFWWLNNGIKVISEIATLAGKKLTIKNPQVVNGLQTSMEVYKYFRDHPNAQDDRRLLVRVIIPKSEASRNRIIKATNSQTTLPAASLRATDQIQRDLEQFFEANGLFYDRRKNYHKNLGRRKDKIVSIPYLSQAVMAIVLQEPNNARARPSTLITKDIDYNRVFNPEYPIHLYLECAKFMKLIDAYLVSGEAPAYVKNNEINIRYQLAMFSTVMAQQRLSIEPKDIPALGLSSMSKITLRQNLNEVWEVFVTMKSEQNLESDVASKSPEFDKKLVERLQGILTSEL